MIQQCYIKNRNYYLLACTYVPDEYDTVVILLQGFSHSMTDIDYFMTNVKNQLVVNKCAVVQFDPFGHGDSDGSIERFDFNILLDDLNTVTEWVKLQFGFTPILVTRGLYELAVYNTGLHNKFHKCIILNPVCLSYEEYRLVDEYISNQIDIIDFNEWFRNVHDNDKKFIEDLFYLFGAKLKNLQGQFLNISILKEYISLIADRKTSIPINVYYVYSNSDQKIIMLNNCIFPNSYTVEYFSDYGALPRDPDWHSKIIEHIVYCCTNT